MYDRAEVTVNGKPVAEGLRHCVVIVIPPGVALPDLERVARSSWRDGTGTTALIVDPEELT